MRWRGRWLREFFRPRQFDVEWDGKVRGHGSANVGVAVIPGGVPLLDGANMEEKIREKAGAGAGVAGRDAAADVELQSFVDDMCADIVVWEGGCNVQRVEANVKRIANCRSRRTRRRSCI